LLNWAYADIGHGLIARGQAQEGLALLMRALAHFRAMENAQSLPMLLTWLAEAHAMLGQPAEAESYLAEAAKLIGATDERFYEAEWHRVSGDLLKAVGDEAEAEQHYRQAIAVAERQGAKLFQLRASTSLARLWHDQKKPAEAYDLLAPVYDWFTEGFDAQDLKDARTLLNDLEPAAAPEGQRAPS
jgi:predicted ATPase